MCGRYSFFARRNDIVRSFAGLQLPDDYDANTPPRYNIAPTQAILTITAADPTHLQAMRWGLIPSWAKTIGTPLINARVETIAEKPSFRSAFRSRHCLVLSDGWYEWIAGEHGRRQAIRIEPSDGRVVGLAGIWERWTAPDGTELMTSAIITRQANGTLATIHDRMPIVIEAARAERWLHADSVDDSLAMLMEEPGLPLRAFPVGLAVNSARNDGPYLRDPIPGAWCLETVA